VRALELAAAWPRLLATVRWIDERQLAGMYVRQVDVPGVDTKFIEQELYADLVKGTFEPAIRLEQERIGFAAVDEAIITNSLIEGILVGKDSNPVSGICGTTC
jgi:hypothetical protein